MIFYELPYSNQMAYIVNADGQIVVGSKTITWPKGYLGYYSYRTAYFTSSRRIVGRLREFPELGMHQFEAITTSQRKIWPGIWIQEKIDEIANYKKVGYFYDIDGYGPFTISAGGAVNSNRAVVRQNITRWNHAIDFDRSTCIVDFRGKRGTTEIWIKNEEVFPDNL